MSAQLLPRPGEQSAPETSLPAQSCVQNGQTQPPSLKTRAGEVETLMQEEITVPFNLQFRPLHYCEGHDNTYGETIFKAEFTTPLQNSMLDATKLMLSLYLLSGSIFISDLIFLWRF